MRGNQNEFATKLSFGCSTGHFNRLLLKSYARIRRDSRQRHKFILCHASFSRYKMA